MSCVCADVIRSGPINVHNTHREPGGVQSLALRHRRASGMSDVPALADTPDEAPTNEPEHRKPKRRNKKARPKNAFSPHFEFCVSGDKGIECRAVAALPAGTQVLLEPAYAFIIRMENVRQFCASCLKRVAPDAAAGGTWSCRQCNLLACCSDACFTSAMALHDLECSVRAEVWHALCAFVFGNRRFTLSVLCVCLVWLCFGCVSTWPCLLALHPRCSSTAQPLHAPARQTPTCCACSAGCARGWHWMGCLRRHGRVRRHRPPHLSITCGHCWVRGVPSD